MARELDKLESVVECEMELLRGLPAETPSDSCLARIRTAALAENRRLVQRERWMRASRVVGVAAAAVLLVVGLTFSAGSRPDDAEVLLGEWAAAWDTSREQVADLLDEGWIVRGTADAVDEDTAIDDLFQSLSRTLDRFEDL